MKSRAGRGNFSLGTMMMALPMETVAPRTDTMERRGLVSGRTTPTTPKASGVERAEPV